MTMTTVVQRRAEQASDTKVIRPFQGKVPAAQLTELRRRIKDRTLDDADLDPFVDALVRRLASFDRETLAAAKAQINRFGRPTATELQPTATELQSSTDVFFSAMAWPSAQARRAKLRNLGYALPSDFELNFGRCLPQFGRADEDETDTPSISV